jgi:hypothetical protein
VVIDDSTDCSWSFIEESVGVSLALIDEIAEDSWAVIDESVGARGTVLDAIADDSWAVSDESVFVRSTGIVESVDALESGMNELDKSRCAAVDGLIGAFGIFVGGSVGAR